MAGVPSCPVPPGLVRGSLGSSVAAPSWPLGLCVCPWPLWLSGGCLLGRPRPGVGRLASLALLGHCGCSGLRCPSHMHVRSGLASSCRVPLLSDVGTRQNALSHFSDLSLKSRPLCIPPSLMPSGGLLFAIRTPTILVSNSDSLFVVLDGILVVEFLHPNSTAYLAPPPFVLSHPAWHLSPPPLFTVVQHCPLWHILGQSNKE